MKKEHLKILLKSDEFWLGIMFSVMTIGMVFFIMCMLDILYTLTL